MEWIVIAVFIGAPLIIKMLRNYKQNRNTQKILNVLQRHSPEEIREIAQWELQLRMRLAEQQLLLESGQISDKQFLEASGELLAIHRKIERKYNITEQEMVEYYQLVSKQ